MKPYETPEVVTLGEAEDVVRGPGELDAEGCGCTKYLFMHHELPDEE